VAAETNRAIVRAWFDAFNTNNLDRVDDLFAPDVVDYTAPPGAPPGVAGMKALISVYRAAFPDIHFTVEQIIAEDDRMAGQWTARGTQTGPLLDIPPTGKPMEISGIFIMHVSGDKVTEHWVQFDQMGMLQQLGVIPGAPETT